MRKIVFDNVSLKGIYTIIESFQKLLNAYERIQPVVVNTIPMVNNIKTTIKVMGAFKNINKLNKNFDAVLDSLPDYIDENSEKQSEFIAESDVANPYYPWYTICRWYLWM